MKRQVMPPPNSNRAFYVDTLLYILKQYEEELNSSSLTDAGNAAGY